MADSVKKVFLFFPLCIGLTLGASTVQAQIGFAVGYGLNPVSSPSFSSSATNSFDAKGGFNAGLFYNFHFGRVTLRPGMFIRSADFDWELDNVNFSPLQSSFRVAEFPIDLLYHFQMESFNPYVVVGPTFNFLHTDQPDLRQTLDKPQGSTNFASLTVGAGVEFSPGDWGVIFFPEIKYSLAMSGFLREEYIVRTVSFASDSAKLSSITFRLGITLPSY